LLADGSFFRFRQPTQTVYKSVFWVESIVRRVVTINQINQPLLSTLKKNLVQRIPTDITPLESGIENWDSTIVLLRQIQKFVVGKPGNFLNWIGINSVSIPDFDGLKTGGFCSTFGFLSRICGSLLPTVAI
jgi:hypothetical protein